MFLVHFFVYFARVDFCHFSIPLGVRGWLRLVTVALPGLFYFFFNKVCLAISYPLINVRTRHYNALFEALRLLGIT